MNMDEAITNIKRICYKKKIVTLITDRHDAYYYAEGKVVPFKRYTDPSLIRFSNKDIEKYELFKKLKQEKLEIYYSGIMEMYYLSSEKIDTSKRIVLN